MHEWHTITIHFAHFACFENFFSRFCFTHSVLTKGRPDLKAKIVKHLEVLKRRFSFQNIFLKCVFKGVF